MAAPAILIHGGAGSFDAELFADEPRTAQVLHEVLHDAAVRLTAGGAALDVAVEAVGQLESFELFNAGYGAALCLDGTVELSAGLMRGTDRAAGAVAGARTTEHPIAAARAVLDSDQVLLIGEAADARAAAHGIAQRDNEWFVTDRQRARLAERVVADHGTVGAVCLDTSGALAAATSTGGITGQPPGRVGDTPLIGAGTWADARVAISCTGQGEAFIRSGTARHIAELVAAGCDLASACRLGLDDVTALGGGGGLIALAADGTSALPFTTEAMPRGRWRAATGSEVWVRTSDPQPTAGPGG
jgi:beta-aspartyl-peptidase (threonine type)